MTESHLKPLTYFSWGYGPFYNSKQFCVNSFKAAFNQSIYNLM